MKHSRVIYSDLCSIASFLPILISICTKNLLALIIIICPIIQMENLGKPDQLMPWKSLEARDVQKK